MWAVKRLFIIKLVKPRSIDEPDKKIGLHVTLRQYGFQV